MSDLDAAGILDAALDGRARDGWAVYRFRSRAARVWLLVAVRNALLFMGTGAGAASALVFLSTEGMLRRIDPWLAPVTAAALALGVLGVCGLAVAIAAFRPLRTLLRRNQNVLVITPERWVCRLDGRIQDVPLGDVTDVTHTQRHRFAHQGAFFHLLAGLGPHAQQVSVRRRSTGTQQVLLDRAHFGPLAPLASTLCQYTATQSRAEADSFV